MAFRTEVPEIYMHLASAAIQKYFFEYFKIKEWIDEAKKIAKREGVCRSPFGRIEHLPNINSAHNQKRTEEERQAVNMPIQSGAADITIKALIKLDRWFTANPETAKKWDIIVVNTVHDSIVFDMKTEYVEESSPIILGIMEDISELDFMLCPLKVDVEVGDNYGELEDYADWLEKYKLTQS